MRILLVSQMYPGADDPDLGVFVAQIERALRERGHDLELAVLDHRGGGKRRYLELARRARPAARRFRPDVVYAHFLVPSGLVASLASRAPLVVTAHGRDVRNIGTIPGVAAATRYVVGRADTVVAVSEYLRRELEAKIPTARGKTEVLDSGVDLDRFAFAPRAPGPTTRFLCLGSLTERKNVIRLADAFLQLDDGALTFVGDGPQAATLRGKPGVEVRAAVDHADVPALIAAHDVVCQPSLIEPFGQAVLEALAVGRPVVASRIGGAAEFVPPEAGVLVDPLDTAAIVGGMRAAASLPVPNEAARAAAAVHDVKEQARRLEAILARACGGRRA